MQTIGLSDVILPENRFRRDFDPARIADLGESILTKGLQHAVVLRNDRRTLVSGERRLRALRALYAKDKRISYDGQWVPLGQVPYTTLADLTPLELLEAEYEENVVRTDFSWLEKAEALAKLHKLRTAQAEAAGRVQTMSMTMAEVSGKPADAVWGSKVRNAMLLTDFAKDPDVAGAKSEKEAFNIVKKKLTDKFTAALAKNIAGEARATPHVALEGDCTTLLASLDDGTFDVLLTDPPYGVDAHKFAATDGSASGTKHRYVDSAEYAQQIMRVIVEESVRLCKPDSALYMFCDYKHFAWLTGLVGQHGWTPWDRPIFWHKPGGGMMGDTLHGPRRSYETIFYAYRGNKRTTGTFLDVIVHQPKDDPRHAAAKPMEVYINLLRRSCVPGMTVLDPCMGIGPVFPAANALQLRATGIELDNAHYNTAITRINGKE
jgi:DNA modification methylase